MKKASLVMTAVATLLGTQATATELLCPPPYKSLDGGETGYPFYDFSTWDAAYDACIDNVNSLHTSCENRGGIFIVETCTVLTQRNQFFEDWYTYRYQFQCCRLGL